MNEKEIYAPAKERNNSIWTSTQLARTEYFGLVVWGADGSHFSVVYDSHLKKQIRKNMVNPPYLLSVALSASKNRSMRILQKHSLFELNDTQPDDILYRFAFIYDLLQQRLEDDDRDAQNLLATFSPSCFGLEALYVPEINIQAGKDAINAMDSIPDLLSFLFWIGERIPLLVLIDEISSKEVVPREGAGSIVDDLQKQSIIMLREKCKGVVYPRFYANTNSRVEVPVLIQEPNSKSKDPVVKYYAKEIKGNRLEILRSKGFQTQFDALEAIDDAHKYSATSNVIIFAEDKEQIDADIMKNSYSVEINLPNADIRRALITKLFSDFNADLKKGKGVVTVIKVRYGNREVPGKEAELEFLVAPLAGTNSREINEILGSKMNAGQAYAIVDKSPTGYVYLDDVSEFRKKIINASPALELVEPDHTFDDIQGLTEAKEYLNKIITVVETPYLHPTLPGGFLFSGPPGTGKTYTAEALMKELSKKGFTGVYLHIDKLLGSYVGQTEMQTRQTIDTLRALYKAVVWIDELDRKSMSTETKGPSGDSGTTNRMQTRLMEFFGDGANKGKIILCAATNFPANIDTALFDRFPDRIPFLPPDEQGRADQFKLKLQKMNSDMGDRVTFIPDLDTIALWAAKNAPDVAGRPLENIASSILREAAVKSKDGKIKVDKMLVSSIINDTNVVMGDKADEMIEQAIKFVNPKSALDKTFMKRWKKSKAQTKKPAKPPTKTSSKPDDDML
ncbi:hypothetical protein LCGC14_0195160 [marine sediment metagenome]|uniref:AAA+ ATPase domain-containing protein n=1 Tax=marine sediment metagenome TaxID=412755 RepID=A0A0F9XNA6_9ZZZZ